MTDVPRKLTRAQLTDFLRDHQAVRTFERMQDSALVDMPDALEALAVLTATADARINAATAATNRLAEAIEALLTQPAVREVAAADDLVPPASPLNRCECGAGELQPALVLPAEAGDLAPPPLQLTEALLRTILAGYLAHGTYTPTLTNVTNLDASTASEMHYLRVGSTVVVAGQVQVNPTALAATELRISLPIASTIGANSDVGGAAYASLVTQGAAILGDAANAAARMLWVATDTNNRAMFMCFAYQII